MDKSMDEGNRECSHLIFRKPSQVDLRAFPTNNSIQEKQHKYRSEIALIANAYPKLYREEPDHSRFRWKFMLTSDTPAVRRYFTPGKDLVTAGNKEEMKRVIHYYLNHPAERKAIQHQGQITVRKHMYKHRAQEIIQVLKRKGIITADD
ncbi:hypothetical protein PAEVO_52680 [Paenibacillus sp. GM2FR]|uniref:glycosyltransferase family protein n=1 Tax=Paenibacillus sp. GM2FR TaxID=2059268 RepID=UPI000C278B92|nr:glycosyltransferase [Paenibacillus sp. GM2FR]MDL1162948.1 glycosyltransferase [Yersinia pestis]PJN50224.1 hypothetical protein PAEVO_52680 [Paenibacillus sp. GM2FR]